MDPVDSRVRDFVVRHVAPPGQHVRLGQDRVADALVRVVQGRGPDLEAVVVTQAGRDRAMDPVRVDRLDRGIRRGPGGTHPRP